MSPHREASFDHRKGAVSLLLAWSSESPAPAPASAPGRGSVRPFEKVENIDLPRGAAAKKAKRR